MADLFIYSLLIFLSLSGLVGLFFFHENVKKISSLSISYSSFSVLIIVVALKTAHSNEVLMLMVSILIIFSLNLLIGIGIIKNISEATSKNKDEE